MQDKPLKLDQLLTIEEVAGLLQISKRTIYNQLTRKSANPFPIKSKKIGKLVRFKAQDVADFMDAL